MNCRAGKIKDFIPAVFNDISTDYFKEGQYRLKLTIYALPSSKEPCKCELLPNKLKHLFMVGSDYCM